MASHPPNLIGYLIDNIDGKRGISLHITKLNDETETNRRVESFLEAFCENQNYVANFKFGVDASEDLFGYVSKITKARTMSGVFVPEYLVVSAIDLKYFVGLGLAPIEDEFKDSIYNMSCSSSEFYAELLTINKSLI